MAQVSSLDVADLEIVHYPHPTLRHKSLPVRRVDRLLMDVVRRMFQLMYEARGVGLAANQVDLPLRLFIVNLEAAPDAGEELVFINPVISRPKGTEEAEEGCLSLPGVYGPVKRPKEVDFQAYNLKGERFEGRLDGLFARVVQHELDHLDGVLFPDRIPPTLANAMGESLDEFVTVWESKRSTGEVASDEALLERRAAWEQRYC